MSLRIVLNHPDDPKSPFQTGSQITGSIQIEISSATLSVHESFSQVQLSWTCSSDLQFERKIQVTTGDPVTRTFKSAAILFCYKLLLTERTFLPAASQRGEDGGTIVFPFSVSIPVFAEPIAGEDALSTSETDMCLPDDPWPASANFYIQAGVDFQPQRLPGSSRRSFFYSSGGLVRFEGSLNYNLQADLPGGKKSASLKVAVVDQTPDPTSAELDRWTGRQYDAQVRVIDRLEAPFWKRAFSKDHIPKVNLSVELQSKQVLFLNSRDDEYLPFRIRVTLQRPAREGSQEDLTGLPKVYLTRVCLSLKGNVAARTSPSQKIQYLPHSAHGMDERRIFDWKQTSNKRSREAIPLDTFWDVGLNLGATYDALKSKINDKSQASRRSQPMDLVPDFCLPNLVRNYSLTWSMRFDCGGSKVNWVCDGGIPVKLDAVAGQIESDQELPAYEPV